MKMKSKLLLAAIAVILLAPVRMSAFDLSSLFGNSGSTITNLIEGVFSKTDLELTDLAGEWTIDGSAVAFQSDNFLQKAGGMAASAAIEAKIDPYLQQYGLVGAVMTIQSDGTFVIKTSKASINGKIQKKSSGNSNFTFSITVLGKSISSMPAYVQKSSSSLDIMFEGDKLKSMLTTVGKLLNSSLASTALNILNSYDGVYVGFGMHQTGTVSTSTTTTTTTTNTTTTTTETGGFLQSLGSFLGGGDTSTTGTSTTGTTTTGTSTTGTTTTDTTTNTGSDAISTLFNLLKKK
jgi:hypothetical protein